MVRLLSKRKALYVIIGIIIGLTSIYVAFFDDNSSSEGNLELSKPLVPVDKVSSFNSVVPGVFILSDYGEDYKAIAAIFSSVGYDIMEGSFESYKKQEAGSFILVMPEEEVQKLAAEDIDYLEREIEAGQKAIICGSSELSNRLGIKAVGKNAQISGYTWLERRDVAISFKNPTSLELFSPKDSFKALALDHSDNPVMVSGSYGKGMLIYTGIPLVSDGGLGYEHFPFLIEAIKENLAVEPVLSRNDLAIYVDMDYHKQDNPAELAELIKSYGVDQINLSAWYSKDEYGQLYQSLINECHKRGISVFAWFELPYVSKDFWDEHPEWREKTVSGKDAHIDWRRLMALDNPAALQEIKKYTADFIKSYDWDGVDIAEIYYESPGEGFRNKDKFTPMNDSFRKSFKKKYGTDPIQAFNPLSLNYWKYNKKMKQKIIDYRVELVTRLHEEFLLLCEELKKDKPHLQTSVTVIDSIADKNMRDNIGVDAEEIAKLQEKYHFMLQIEDPYTLWNLGPDRYRVIGEEYRRIMSPGNELSIDINIIERGGEVYPTKKQRGLELYQLVNNASKYTDKVILYALATVEKADMRYISYTTSSDVSLKEISANEYITKANKRFIWNASTENRSFYIDGEKWPFVAKQGVIIPGGEHRLTVKLDTDNPQLLIEDVNGEISNVSYNEAIRFSYYSKGRFYITLNKKPTLIEVDGELLKPLIIENQSNYTVALPQGKHEVRLK